ncbi:MAG: cytochrome [Massilia sp.]|nr:cytochrome [Massilia sp.]
MQQPIARYTRTAMLFHWLIALLIVGAFTLGLIMTDIPGFSPTKLKYYSWHKWAGVTVLGLAALRLLWRLAHPVPAYPSTMKSWEKAAAHHLHLVLYVLMFAVPISGYLYTLSAGVPVVYFGVIPLPVFFDADPALKPVLKSVHYWLTMGLAALVVAHVGAALKHAVINRDGVMRRMLP